MWRGDTQSLAMLQLTLLPSFNTGHHQVASKLKNKKSSKVLLCTDKVSLMKVILTFTEDLLTPIKAYSKTDFWMSELSLTSHTVLK